MTNEEVLKIANDFDNLDVKELTISQLLTVSSTASNMHIASERERWDRERSDKGME